MGENPSKKDFANLVKHNPNSRELFKLWDGEDIRPEILKRAKPAHDYSPVNVSNDAD